MAPMVNLSQVVLLRLVNNHLQVRRRQEHLLRPYNIHRHTSRVRRITSQRCAHPRMSTRHTPSLTRRLLAGGAGGVNRKKVMSAGSRRRTETRRSRTDDLPCRAATVREASTIRLSRRCLRLQPGRIRLRCPRAARRRLSDLRRRRPRVFRRRTVILMPDRVAVAQRTVRRRHRSRAFRRLLGRDRLQS